jgi:hypothetical protein
MKRRKGRIALAGHALLHGQVVTAPSPPWVCSILAEDMQVLKYQNNQTVSTPPGQAAKLSATETPLPDCHVPEPTQHSMPLWLHFGKHPLLEGPRHGCLALVLAPPCRYTRYTFRPASHPASLQYGAHWDDLDLDENPEGLGGGSVRVVTVLIYLSGERRAACSRGGLPDSCKVASWGCEKRGGCAVDLGSRRRAAAEH